MAVNLTKHQDQLAQAGKVVSDDKETQNWALFAYETNTNNLTFVTKGNNGLNELVQEFNCHQIQYALCRVIDREIGINKLLLINWQGESAPLTRKGLCARHVSDVANYFKGCSQTITLRNEDEATEEYIMEQVRKSSSRILFAPRSTSNNAQIQNTSVSLNLQEDKNLQQNESIKTDINTELALNRKSFWAQQEEEERQRLNEEKAKAAERQAQFDKERKLREQAESKKLEEAIKERDRAIEATRQADKGQFKTKMVAVTKENISDEDERVGRRSELLRHERNQETNSLISKGLIKNKRAMFEQACANQQPQQSIQKTSRSSSQNLVRRTSGTIISERLNAFESTSNGSPSSNDNVKQVNGQQENGNAEERRENSISEKLETVKIVNDDIDHKCTVTKVSSKGVKDQEELEAPKVVENIQNGNHNDVSTDLNGNDAKQKISFKADESVKSEEKLLMPEKNENGVEDQGICAKALYDYQAADATEISFDPEDVIGQIAKVDQGWWHGKVLTGEFKGKVGLFPSNYVTELLP